jgi:hypothetical protein
LAKRIRDSHDRLVIVRVQDNPTLPASFRLGQVKLDEQDPSLTQHFGVYRLRWYRQYLEDVHLRSVVNSRFWPDVWTLRTDGTFGHPHAVRPSRATRVTAEDPTLHWKSGDVSLAEDLIVGPFEFSQVRIPMQGPKRQAVSEENRIDEMYWKILTDRAHQFEVDVSQIRLTPVPGQQG